MVSVNYNFSIAIIIHVIKHVPLVLACLIYYFNRCLSRIKDHKDVDINEQFGIFITMEYITNLMHYLTIICICSIYVLTSYFRKYLFYIGSRYILGLKLTNNLFFQYEKIFTNSNPISYFSSIIYYGIKASFSSKLFQTLKHQQKQFKYRPIQSILCLPF